MAPSGFKSYEETETKIKTLLDPPFCCHRSVLERAVLVFYFVIDQKKEKRKEKRSKNIFRVGRNVKRYEGWKLRVLELDSHAYRSFPRNICYVPRWYYRLFPSRSNDASIIQVLDVWVGCKVSRFACNTVSIAPTAQ